MNNFQKDVISCIQRLNSYALHLTKDIDNANDLLQDTLLKAILNESKFKEGTNLNAWLNTIMNNTFLNSIRKSKTFVSSKEYSIENLKNYLEKKSTKNLALENLSIEFLNKVLDTQNDKIVEMLTFYIRGFTYQEISVRLNVPLGTIKSDIHRLRKNIIPYLKKQGYENSKT